MRRIKHTVDELLSELRDFYTTQGRAPTHSEWCQRKRQYAIDTLIGTWNTALEMAGIPVNRVVQGTAPVHCANCGLSFTKQIGRRGGRNDFCSQSCSATYNNKHKTKGTRRSKLECFIEDSLRIKYPVLEIHFNMKTAIGSELDIYIPSLNLAFELNGILHYEPIYGTTKHQQIQSNDKSKYKACLDAGIDLCIIDTSQLKYFKPSNAQQYLDMVTGVIEQRMKSECSESN